MKKIVSFGEIVWDTFSDGRVLGGAPLNFAYYCSRLGIDAKLISAVGRDAKGAAALETMARYGLSTSLVLENEHPTGKVNISLDGGRDATYRILENSAWDYIECFDSAADEVSSADAFVFGTLAQRSEVSSGGLSRLLEACPSGCVKAVDVNLRLNFYTKKTICFSLEKADVVKLNEAELDKICDILGYDGDALMRAKFIFDAFGLKYLILTRGEDGYTIFEKGGMFIGRAKKVKIVDTVGAGDAFFAAFMASVLNGASSDAAAEKGAELAAEVCSRRGAFCF